VKGHLTQSPFFFHSSENLCLYADMSRKNQLTKCQYSEFTNKKRLDDGSPYSEVYLTDHPSFGKCVLKVISRFCERDQRCVHYMAVELLPDFQIRVCQIILYGPDGFLIRGCSSSDVWNSLWKGGHFSSLSSVS